MEKLSPIAKLINESVKCSKCGMQGVGNCDCWIKCKCGWWVEKGESQCNNPKCEHILKPE